MVECNLAKVEVEGSNPFSRSTPFFLNHIEVPSPSGKAKVCKTFIGGSIPPGTSTYFKRLGLEGFALFFLGSTWGSKMFRKLRTASFLWSI